MKQVDQNRISLSRMSKVLGFDAICFQSVSLFSFLNPYEFFFWIISFRLIFSLSFSLLFWYTFDPASILAEIELVRLLEPCCRDSIFFSLPIIKLAELLRLIILSIFYLDYLDYLRLCSFTDLLILFLSFSCMFNLYLLFYLF
jgi:hypothetical protein